MKNRRLKFFSSIFAVTLAICTLQFVLGWHVCLAGDNPKTVMVSPKGICRDMKFAKQIKEMIEEHFKSSEWRLIDPKLLKSTYVKESSQVTPLSEIIKANIIVDFEFTTRKQKDNTTFLTLTIQAYESVS
ncbi:MAG: hypothetical protein JRJ87_13025 [Deltaproteobacteria bacterium]|nr:hypothetical protein [Deltaproteobacteria bacterium]